MKEKSCPYCITNNQGRCNFIEAADMIAAEVPSNADQDRVFEAQKVISRERSIARARGCPSYGYNPN